MPINRRSFIRRAACLPLGLSGFPASSQSVVTQTGDRLVLLGTQGGPFIRSAAHVPSSSVIVYNGTPWIVDTGFGVTFRLLEAGIGLNQIRNIFITHHHSDHNLELGPLLYNAWIAGMKEPVHVYGPAGLNDLLKYYWESNRFDIETRIANEGRPDVRELVRGHEYSAGEVMKGEGVEVAALRNIHPPVAESFALRFRLGNKTVAFSGDTAYCQPLAAFAKGAKYLVHEVMNAAAVDEMVKRRPNAAKLRESILAHHTTTEDAGRIAQEGGVQNLVLNHFVPPDDKSLTDESWRSAAQLTYSGNVIIAKDGLSLAL